MPGSQGSSASSAQRADRAAAPRAGRVTLRRYFYCPTGRKLEGSFRPERKDLPPPLGCWRQRGGAVSSPCEARPILPHFTSPSSHREVASPTAHPPLPGEPSLVLQGPRCKNVNRTAAAETGDGFGPRAQCHPRTLCLLRKKGNRLGFGRRQSPMGSLRSNLTLPLERAQKAAEMYAELKSDRGAVHPVPRK